MVHLRLGATVSPVASRFLFSPALRPTPSPALIASKIIKDAEVEKLLIALRDLHELVEKSKQISAGQRDRLQQYDNAVKKLILDKKVLSTDVVLLLRGKVEAMGEEISEDRS